MVTKKQKELDDGRLKDVIDGYERIPNKTEIQKQLIVLYKWAKLNNKRPAKLRLDERKKKYQIPKCIHCNSEMNPIGSETYQFIGYRCETHQDFYITGIFMKALVDVYSGVL